MPRGGTSAVSGYYDWADYVWAEYDSKNSQWKIIAGFPPRAAGVTIEGISYPNVNRSLIFVDYCHKVKLDDGFNYQNKLDLIVCGELQVGSLVITIPVPEMIVVDVVSNDDLCSDGLYLTGSVNFSEANVTSIGFVVAPDPLINDDGNVVNIYDYLYGTFAGTFSSATTPTILNVPIDDQNNLYFDPITGDPLAYIPGGKPPFDFSLCYPSSGSFQILAFGENGSGIGYSEIYLYPPVGSKSQIISSKPFLFEKNEGDEGTTSTFNNFTLTLCDSTSLFKVDNLIVGNNTTLNINGTFYVDAIVGTSNGCQTNNFCVYGSGVILTPEGGIPDFECITGWEDVDGDGYPDAYLDPDYSGQGNTPNCGFLEGTLPVELLSFTPSIKPDRVELNWTTGTEINNDFFTIERSRDLYGWEVLGFVQGAGNSSIPLDYGFTDFRPLDGLGYYRLKQTDFDGKFKYYGPIAAHYDLGLEGLDFKVMKSFSNWVIAVPNDGFYQVEVYNLQGHRLHSERVENTLSIPAPEGAVVIRVTDGFERSASRVVM